MAGMAPARRILVLEFPMPPSACSPNARVSRFEKAAAVREYRTACRTDALNVRNTNDGDYPLIGPVGLCVTFRLATRARRDWDNLIASFKPGLDGIVDAGLIGDDNVWVLPRPVFNVAVAKKTGVTVTLEELRV